MCVLLRPSVVLMAAVVVGVLGLTAVACGGPDNESGVSTQRASRELPLVEISTRWATVNASDLKTLIESHPIVFVGTVIRLASQRDESVFPGDGLPRGDSDLPGIGSFPRIPVSLYEIRVDAPLFGDLREGQAVWVQQAGGIMESADGSLVRVILELDEPLAELGTYMFFVRPALSDEQVLVTSPFARLRLGTDGRFRPLKSWLDAGAMRELDGLSGESAGEKVRLALTPEQRSE